MQLKNVEIFRTGTHTDSSGHTRTWTKSDLEKIVRSYDPKEHEAPVVIGHPQEDHPAYGWVERVKIVGDRLLADFNQVVDEFAQAVKDGLFKKRSIALYPDGSLRHVGFLGAMPPAVKGLKNVAFSKCDDIREYEFSETGGVPADSKEHGMDAEELKKQLDAATKAREEAEAARDKALEGKKDAEKKLSEFSEQQIKAQRISRVEKLIADGKLLPAQKDEVVRFAEALGTSKGVEFSDSKGKKQSAEEHYWALLETHPAHGLFHEFAQPANPQAESLDTSELTSKV